VPPSSTGISPVSSPSGRLRRLRPGTGISPFIRGASHPGAVGSTSSPPRSNPAISTFEARHLKARNKGYYTIGSTGHEANAVRRGGAPPRRPGVPALPFGGLLLRTRAAGPRDRRGARRAPRDGGFLGRPRSPAGATRSSASKPMWIPPQTSTIASHLPQGGRCGACARTREGAGLALPVPNDAVMVCSFGDASANDNVAAGAVNTALWAWHRGGRGAGALRLRGQRHRHFRADARRLDRGRLWGS
jgi:hypothetical protein